MASVSNNPPATGHEKEELVRRDRLWLLPSNRKLRNVVAISLRNLSLVPYTSRGHRGQTTDDDALPNTLTSPAKIVALREHKALEHSRSSSDLRRVEEEDGALSSQREFDHAPHGNGKLSTPKRPSFARMRRRSTLEWANATPHKRHERLEQLTAERMASVFFTCHVDGVEEPIYISETVPRTMNPTFRHIDLSSCGPGITRMDAMTVRIWVKSAKMERWRQLLRLSIQLRDLHYLGKNLVHSESPLAQNAVIFQLNDGVYATSTSMADLPPPIFSANSTGKSIKALPSSSFDALLRLSKLDDSIQDALATRDKLAANLENLLQCHKQALVNRDEVAEAKDRLKTIDYAKMTVEKQLEKARRQLKEKRVSLQARRDLMAADLQHRQREMADVRKARQEFPDQREEREIKLKAIEAQRRRICEDLQACYPLQPLPKQSLAFTIQDLYLPNSEDLDDEPPDKVAAALGHVAHIVLLLSYYLRQPLPYPLRARSSSSTIEDPLSLLKATSSSSTPADDAMLRTYPLFSRGVPRFRFDYAVFLLNKDIQVMLESAYNVRTVDLRHTLPNLKYLLYVATAGAGELPARKAGGVRGLLRASSGGSLGKENGRDDTNGSTFGSFRRTGEGGRPRSAVESLRRNFAGAGRKLG